MVLSATNVSNSAASATRSRAPGGDPTDIVSNLASRISTSLGAAPAGATSRTVESLVAISIASFVGTCILTAGGSTVSVTRINRGVFTAPRAVMVIRPMCVPAISPEVLADTCTRTLACGLFDDADVGENDSQLVLDDTVNGIFTRCFEFHTETGCAGGLPPP